MGLINMPEYDFSKELKRFKAINKYGDKFITEQEAPLPPVPTDAGGAAPAADPMGIPDLPPVSGDTETPEMPEASAEKAGTDDTTEEIDITDLVNMTKSIKKQLDDQPKADVGANQKMDDVFAKLGELETKLGEMDQVLAKIDQLGSEVQQMKPKTPVEKLEMRSLDSYPFNQNPTEFFNQKQQEMKASGKNEYLLTKGDVENYGKYEIMKSFNPKAEENDYNF
jgi:hypothetical protein